MWQGALGALITFIIIHNIITLPQVKYEAHPGSIAVLSWLNLYQAWYMFSPLPLPVDGVVQLYGINTKGDSVNLQKPGAPLLHSLPSPQERRYRNEREVRYMEGFRHYFNAKRKTFMADYYYRHYKEEHADGPPIVEVGAYFIEETTDLNYGSPTVRRRQLLRYFPADAPREDS